MASVRTRRVPCPLQAPDIDGGLGYGSPRG